MTPARQVDYVLDDCFFAVGQRIGTQKTLDFGVVPWWRDRYRRFFLHAMEGLGNSWEKDRHRVTAVGRYLGERALFHAGDSPVIDLLCARKASEDVERGCQMNAVLEGVRSGRPAPSAPDLPAAHCGPN
jgi:hypothetical protein